MGRRIDRTERMIINRIVYYQYYLGGRNDDSFVFNGSYLLSNTVNTRGLFCSEFNSSNTIESLTENQDRFTRI